MARARNIKPGFFCNEKLAELPFVTRLLFIGLWTIADRAGRLEDRPKRIKMEIFPADNVEVDALLDALQTSGFITRYAVNGSQYIQCDNFTKHQNPHINERPSTIPAPELHGASTVQAPVKHHGTRADSLIPDSSKKHLAKLAAPSAGFDSFWNLYPKKKAKGYAIKTWDKLNPDPSLVDRILKAVAAADWPNDETYIPHPASWLNSQGWLDEAAPVRPLQVAF